MIFRKPQKKVEIPVLHIGGENIDCVNNFNFLGIVLNEHLTFPPLYRPVPAALGSPFRRPISPS